MSQTINILIVNPNSNHSMTLALHAPINSLAYNNTTYTYLTGPPSSPYSINSPTDAALSATTTLPHILSSLSPTEPKPTNNTPISAILIACYSPHPLVSLLQTQTPPIPIPILGILEASITTATQLLHDNEIETETETFGIISTGDGWGPVLTKAVEEMMGGRRGFAGVETCGVDAGDLHGGEGEVEGRVRAATRRLVFGEGGKGKRGVGVVVLGCAGMGGMEEWVREEGGEGIRVVDGVRAGVGILQGLVRGGF